MTNRSMKHRRNKAPPALKASKAPPMQARQPTIALSRTYDASGLREADERAPDGRAGGGLPSPGFSSVMSRVCELVWPVWPDTASSERDGDLAGSERTTMVAGACGTSVSRHSVLQRTPVGPVDQRRAVYAPI